MRRTVTDVYVVAELLDCAHTGELIGARDEESVYSRCLFNKLYSINVHDKKRVLANLQEVLAQTREEACIGLNDK